MSAIAEVLSGNASMADLCRRFGISRKPDTSGRNDMRSAEVQRWSTSADVLIAIRVRCRNRHGSAAHANPCFGLQKRRRSFPELIDNVTYDGRPSCAQSAKMALFAGVGKEVFIYRGPSARADWFASDDSGSIPPLFRRAASRNPRRRSRNIQA